MNQQWKDFLENRGYAISEEGETLRLTSSDNGDKGTTALTALTHSALLKVAGPDSEKFLQGQLTCDVTKVTTRLSNPGAACTPHGRVFSNFQLIKSADEPVATFFLRMHSGIIDSTLQTLGKYAVFFKADLSSCAEDYVGIGVWGDNAEPELRKIFNISPETANAVQIDIDQFILRVQSDTPRFEYWGPVDAAKSLWSTLESNCQVMPTSAWELEDIRSGIAHISPDTTEGFTPHMLNYKSHNGISFDKGCYTGQEIVARTEYRGKAKRALHWVNIEGDTPPLMDSQLSVDGKSAAPITQAKTSDNTAILLVAPPEFEQGQRVAIEIGETTLRGEIRAFG